MNSLYIVNREVWFAKQWVTLYISSLYCYKQKVFAILTFASFCRPGLEAAPVIWSLEYEIFRADENGLEEIDNDIDIDTDINIDIDIDTDIDIDLSTIETIKERHKTGGVSSIVKKDKKKFVN